MSIIVQYKFPLSGSTTESFENNFVTASAFMGDGTQITGVISASYALTASYVSGSSGASISSSYSNTASYASSTDVIRAGQVPTSSISFVLPALPTIISASYAVTSSTSYVLNGFSASLFLSPSIAANTDYTSSITLVNRFILFEVSASSYSRIRLYNSFANQLSDLSRPTASLASASIGLLLDVVLSGSIYDLWLTPPAICYGGTGSFSNIIPLTVSNCSGSSTTISASFKYLPL